LFAGQEGRGENGERCVLRSADIDAAAEFGSAVNDEFFHDCLCCLWGAPAAESGGESGESSRIIEILKRKETVRFHRDRTGFLLRRIRHPRRTGGGGLPVRFRIRERFGRWASGSRSLPRGGGR